MAVLFLLRKYNMVVKVGAFDYGRPGFSSSLQPIELHVVCSLGQTLHGRC